MAPVSAVAHVERNVFVLVCCVEVCLAFAATQVRRSVPFETGGFLTAMSTSFIQDTFCSGFTFPNPTHAHSLFFALFCFALSTPPIFSNPPILLPSSPSFTAAASLFTVFFPTTYLALWPLSLLFFAKVDREIVELYNLRTSHLWDCLCARSQITTTTKRKQIFFHNCKGMSQLKLCGTRLLRPGVGC